MRLHVVAQASLPSIDAGATYGRREASTHSQAIEIRRVTYDQEDYYRERGLSPGAREPLEEFHLTPIGL